MHGWTGGVAAGGWQAGEDPLEENPWPWVWNYLLGGGDYFESHRVFAEALRKAVAWDGELARARLLARRRLVEQSADRHGVDQFVVMCADFPRPELRHGPQRPRVVDEALEEVQVIAEQAIPKAKTVYVSPDPVVAAHARALFRTESGPTCPCIQAAPDDPVAILDGVSRELDLSRPVAVVMIDAWELLDAPAAQAMVAAFSTVLAPGSHLGVVHLTGTPDAAVALKGVCAAHQVPTPHLRGPADVAALLGDGELTGVHERVFRRPIDTAVWSATMPIGGGA
ncbi:SAM-dependent methyltransferase [Actinomadura syzygii]|uniref:SAM-dependent methyltransferase n=1 Tax=Actinomadura syzygii TaxID=1427538 RepID=UPI001651F4A3|nr:SAM-dependent methyltransferase [Actinomadura syzygii]